MMTLPVYRRFCNLPPNTGATANMKATHRLHGATWPWLTTDETAPPAPLPSALAPTAEA
jgi:hypothetical protein